MTSTESRSADRSIPVPWILDKLVHISFSLLAKLHRFRNAHPKWLKAILLAPSALISYWLTPIIRTKLVRPILHKVGVVIGRQVVVQIGSWVLQRDQIAAQVQSATVHLFLGGTSYLVLWVSLAALAYAQRSLAVNALGLIQASLNPKALHDFLNHYLRPGIHPENENIG